MSATKQEPRRLLPQTPFQSAVSWFRTSQSCDVTPRHPSVGAPKSVEPSQSSGLNAGEGGSENTEKTRQKWGSVR